MSIRPSLIVCFSGYLLLSLVLSACTAAPAFQGAPVPSQGENSASMPTPTSQPILPLNVAHRGARSLAPENTLTAARKALEVGADMWETDVTLTADGKMVILHDSTLGRTTNIEDVFPLRVADPSYSFSLDELRQLDFGSWFVDTDPFQQIATGAVSQQEQASYAGEPAPTLRQALVFTKENDWRINVEIKDQEGTPGDTDLPEKVVALIDELEMAPSVVVSSFNHSYLKRVKAADPQITTAALVDTPSPDPIRLLQELQAQAYNPKLAGLDMEQVRQVRQAGFDVYVWTVNDERDVRRLIEAGATGIITDFPQRLATILAEYR